MSLPSQIVGLLVYAAFFFSILLISLNVVSAGVETEFLDKQVYRQSTDIDVRVVCYNNGTYCTPSATCNMTLSLPNSTILLNNIKLQNRTNYHNVTLRSSQTDVSGYLNYDVTCTDGGVSGKGKSSLYINPSGNIPTTSQSIIYLIAFLTVLLMFSLCLWGAIAIPWDHPRGDDGMVVKFNDLRFVKILVSIFAYVSLIALTFLGYNISWGYLEFNVASNILNAFYWTLISLFWPMIVVSFVVIVVQIIYSKKLKRMIDRGLDI